jgi:hypothetical protein
MNKDFRLATDFFDHPKTIRLRRTHGEGAVLSLIRLWAWVARHRPTGDLGDLEREDLNEIAGWSNDGHFSQVLVLCGFMDDESTLHDWQEHQPWVIRAPARTEKAKAAARARWEKKDREGMLGECSEHDSNAQGNAKAMLKQCPSAPSPSPSPSPGSLFRENPSQTRSRKRELASLQREWNGLFPDWYETFPRKEARAAGEKAWEQVGKSHIPRLTPSELFDNVMAVWGAQSPEISERERKHQPLPATWLRANSFADEAVLEVL